MTYLLAIAAATLLRAVAIAAAIARATVVRLRLVAQAIAGIATSELGLCLLMAITTTFILPVLKRRKKLKFSSNHRAFECMEFPKTFFKN